jgi:predicted small lipoprotein YifL
MSRSAVILVVLAFLSSLAGCSGSQPVAGGTTGVLRLGDQPLRDVQIHVHQPGVPHPIGFGVSTEGGAFELFQPGAKGPLHLQPGEYSFTLEPLGPESIPLPRAVTLPAQTPLQRTWTADDTQLELTIK